MAGMLYFETKKRIQVKLNAFFVASLYTSRRKETTPGLQRP